MESYSCRGHLARFILMTLPIVIFAMVPVDAEVGNVLGHAMAKRIDPSTGTPIDYATRFLTTDEAAHSWFEIKMDTFGLIVFIWRWYEPTGSLYASVEKALSVEYGKVYRLWGTLPIRGAPPAEKQGAWRVEIFARETAEVKLFGEPFSISTPVTTYKIAVSVSGLDPKFSAVIYLDGASRGTIAASKSIEFTFDIGSSHNVSVDRIVRGDPGTRYCCEAPSWTTSSDSSYTFTYTTQYELTVNSEYSTPTGAGWYNAGTSATISVNTPTAGPIGVQYVFKEWSGDSTSTSPQTRIVMDGPKRATAVWTVDYTQFYVIVTVITACAAILAVLPIVTSRRRALKTRRPALPRPKPPSLSCSVCGRPTIHVSRTDRYYCTYCKKYV